jgi:hypothetical protein
LSVKTLNEKTKECFGKIYERKSWDELVDYIPQIWDGKSTFSEMEVTIALE